MFRGILFLLSSSSSEKFLLIFFFFFLLSIGTQFNKRIEKNLEIGLLWQQQIEIELHCSSMCLLQREIKSARVTVPICTFPPFSVRKLRMILEDTVVREGLIHCLQLAQSAGWHSLLSGLPCALAERFTREEFASLILSWLGQDSSFCF